MRELVIDWNGLHNAFQMNMPEVRCFLSLDDGKVIKVPPGDPNLHVIAVDPHRYLPIETIPSRIQYQWVDDFVKSVTDPITKARIEAAINGKGAFRRFKDILMTMPDERRRWFEFRDQMIRQRIIDWVLEHGIKAVNAPVWQEPLSAVPPVTAVPSIENENVLLQQFFTTWAGENGLGLTADSALLLVQALKQKFYVKSIVG